MKKSNKLLYVSYAGLPSTSANSVQIMKMCEALGKRFRVKLTTPYRMDDSTQSDIYSFYGVEPTFKIARGRFSKAKSSFKFYIYYFLSALKAKIFSWNVFTRSPIACLFCVIFRVNCVLEVHDTIRSTSNLMDRLYSKYRLFESRYILKIIVISEALKNHYLEYGCTESKLLVLHDAVNEHLFDIPLNMSHRTVENTSNLETSKKIGYVGSFAEGKGADTVIQIANLDSNNTYHLYGGEAQEISVIKKLVKNGNVYFYGHIPNAKVPEVLSNLDILLMPYKSRVYSRGNAGEIGSWMSPMKMFEYMASGKPVISSNLPVIREVLVNGSNSILVSPENISAWCQAIQSLAQNEELSKRISARAREDVSQFTWRSRADRIFNLY